MATDRLSGGFSPALAEDDVSAHKGLDSSEARARLERFGPNAMPEADVRLLRLVVDKFWAPVPWMLEVAIGIQLLRERYLEAAIIFTLLLFNAGIGLVQERRSQSTLAALKSRLALNASVRRDGIWKIVPAVELVPGDLVKLSLGDVVAADMRLVSGNVLLDQSMLTGESMPVAADAGKQAYASSLVRRGEAEAEVTATGADTTFGRTAELVRAAHVASTQQKAVLRVVRNLAFFNGFLVLLLVAHAWYMEIHLQETIQLILTAVLASIPVALPATFTLASALAAQDLAEHGVLLTRLSAVDEAATVNILCSDKTGTLTRNALAVTVVQPMPGFDEANVLALAALASSDGGQDLVDRAIRSAASANPAATALVATRFVPFDPATKMAEATVRDRDGKTCRVVKGAFATVGHIAQPPATAISAAEMLERQGYRVLAVAAGSAGSMRLAGLIALSDPPRADSAALIGELRDLGVRTVMVTGDAPATAATVARKVGIEGEVCTSVPIPDDIRPERFAVFAGVLPEDKYRLVKALQKGGHTIGMCGDGANDAPALRQAQIGIAVSTATDVAKSAAGMVLTEPGLGGIVAAVKEGRATFQRVLTYTLNSIIKKVVSVLFLVVGLVMTGHAILTPSLMVIVMVTGDFLAMALTTDNVRPSPTPNAWHIGKLTQAGVILGFCQLAFCTAMVAVGKFVYGADLEALRTLAFVSLVFGSQATIYAIRQRHRRLWDSRPSLWLVLSSVADIAIASVLAVLGLAMGPLPAAIVAWVLVSALAFAFVLDLLKVPVFRYLKIIEAQ